MEYKYFESHAHYYDKAYDSDREELLSSLSELSVGIVLNSGASMKGSRAGVQLSEKYPFICCAVGVHPHNVKNMTDGDIDELRELAGYEKTVAIGEIGLDYYYDYSPRDLQKKWFIEQINLAKETKLPIIVHSRDAAEDTMEIVKDSGACEVSGVIHCYSGEAPMAFQYIDMGFYIGVGGVVTYKNARKLVEVVKEIPIEKILIETDCPYLSPEPKRGQRNDSGNLGLIAAKIAQIKGISESDVRRITFENGLRLFSRSIKCQTN